MSAVVYIILVLLSLSEGAKPMGPSNRWGGGGRDSNESIYSLKSIYQFVSMLLLLAHLPSVPTFPKPLTFNRHVLLQTCHIHVELVVICITFIYSMERPAPKRFRHGRDHTQRLYERCERVGGDLRVVAEK